MRCRVQRNNGLLHVKLVGQIIMSVQINAMVVGVHCMECLVQAFISVGYVRIAGSLILLITENVCVGIRNLVAAGLYL